MTIFDLHLAEVLIFEIIKQEQFFVPKKYSTFAYF